MRQEAAAENAHRLFAEYVIVQEACQGKNPLKSASLEDDTTQNRPQDRCQTLGKKAASLNCAGRAKPAGRQRASRRAGRPALDQGGVDWICR